MDSSKTCRITKEEAVPYQKLSNIMMGLDTQPKPQMITPYRCDTCGKYFTQKPGLKKHIRIHTGERPYKCPICNRGFTQSSSCKIHLRTHTGEKPHKCHICGRCFPHSSTLVNHIRGHTGEKCYKCQWCGRAFTCRNYLRTHIRVHTGERPYKCVDCGKAFSQLSNLMQHNRDIHTKEKRFKCEICDRAFGRLETLQCHLRTHMGEHRYKCGICQNTFSQKPLLKMHFKTHFGDLLTAEQEKILLETSELFNENIMNMSNTSMDSTEGVGTSQDQTGLMPKITLTSSFSTILPEQMQITSIESPPASLVGSPQIASSPMNCSPPSTMSQGPPLYTPSSNNSPQFGSPAAVMRNYMPRKLVSPGEETQTRKSGLTSLLNPRDLEETLSSVYVVGGAAITCNLLLWTILAVNAVKNYQTAVEDHLEQFGGLK